MRPPTIVVCLHDNGSLAFDDKEFGVRSLAVQKESQFALQRLKDPVPRAVASVVCSIMYPKEDRDQFTSEDVAKLRWLAESCPEELQAKGLPSFVVETLPAQLEILQSYLATERGQWAEVSGQGKTPPRPFCRVINPEALADTKLKQNAQAIAECYDRGGQHLGLGEFLKVRRLLWRCPSFVPPTSTGLSASQAGLPGGAHPAGAPWAQRPPEYQLKRPLSPADEAAAERLEECLQEGRIDPQMVEALHMIFWNEKLARTAVQQGPVSIGSRDFEHVYKLDLGSESIKELDRDQIKSLILRRFESKESSLHECFYDRLYVKRNDELFLVLSDGGSIIKGKNAISPDALVEMRDGDRNIADSGRVVHRQTAVNTLRRALTKVFSDTLSLFTGDPRLAGLLEAESRLAPSSNENSSWVMKVAVGSLMAAQLIQAAGIWAPVGLGVVGVFVTGLNVYRYTIAANSPFKMKPVYNAIGVGLTRDEP